LLVAEVTEFVATPRKWSPLIAINVPLTVSVPVVVPV